MAIVIDPNLFAVNADGSRNSNYPLGDKPSISSNYITASDITLFEEHAIEGAKGGDTNSDGQSHTGWFEQTYTISQDGGRDVNNAWLICQYDTAYVAFKQIDYFGAKQTPPTDYSEARWLDYVTAYDTLYIGDYLRTNSFGSTAYYRYSEGMREMYLRKQANPILAIPTISQQDMQDIRDDPVYSRMHEYKNSGQYPWGGYTREVAYALQSHIDAEKCGVARANDRLDLLVDAAKAKLVDKQQQTGNWTGSYTTLDDSTLINYNEPQDMQKPWMMGLLIKALLDFYDWEVANGRGSDARVTDIPDKVYDYLNWILNTALVVSGDAPDTASLGERIWVENDYTNSNYSKQVSGFRYADRNWVAEGGANDTSSENKWFDLNALVTYGYFWLCRYYQSTDIPKAQNCLDWGEQVWLGALYSGTNKYVGDFAGGKQYNQQMRWMFDCLDIRTEVLT